MAEREKNKQPQAAASPDMADMQAEAPATPNRDRYKAMFAEDYPDDDFEDKETRYGKMIEDRERYNQYRKSGRALSETFDKHRWLAAMLQDLRENEDLDPITWMAQNGIDINEALQDEEYAKQISDKIADFQKKQVEGEKAEAEKLDNLQKSADTLNGLKEEFGLSDEDCSRLWESFMKNILVPADNGLVEEDTWRMLIKAQNYDTDVKTAREEGARNAGNAKITNRLRKSQTNTPPTLNQGTAQRVTAQPQQRSSFWEGMEDY